MVVPSLPNEEADGRLAVWRRENDPLGALADGDVSAEELPGKRRYWVRREALDRVVSGLYDAITDPSRSTEVISASARALGRLICLLGDEPDFGERRMPQAAIDSFIEAWAEANG